MSKRIITKAIADWLFIVVLAIINGALRESVLVPMTGMPWALPLSGVILSLLVLITSYSTVGWMGCSTYREGLFVGVLWVFLTLAFEFLFGHYVVQKSWAEISQVFNLTAGNLFILVLVVCLIAPVLMVKFKSNPE